MTLNVFVKGLVWFAGAISPTLASAEYVDDWGPAIGSAAPTVEALDEAGQLRTLENLAGERGLLLFFNRSADW